MINSKKMRCVGYIGHVGEIRIAYTILVDKSEGEGDT